MKNYLRVVALCGLAMVTTGSGAWAQTRSKYEANSTAVKIGVFNPGSGVARRAGGDYILNFEADLVVQHMPERSEIGVFSIGYTERDNLRLIPITISQIHYDNKTSSSYDIYYGYGLGVYSARLNVADTSGTNKTLIGAHVVAGWNLSEKNFIEARYHYTAKYDNKFVGGLQLMFGHRL